MMDKKVDENIRIFRELNDLYKLTEEEKYKLIDKQRKKCVLLRSKIVTKRENIINRERQV